ncbi:MAG TPA: hypothetical protein VJ576_20025 [Rhodocyclaceae bacterium]|nr:hypothetical protein [Rhodocyclaceae bacterium]
METEEALSTEKALALIEYLHGQAISIPFALIRRVGGVDLAAFVAQAAWLSMHASQESDAQPGTRTGWFFLEQEGEGVAKSGLYKEMGSWERLLGISKKRQEALRSTLAHKGWLCELPSVTGQARGQKAKGDLQTAFLFIQRRGTPPRLYYKVDPVKYLGFLMQPIDSTKRSQKLPFEGGGMARTKKTKCAIRTSSKNPYVYKIKALKRKEINQISPPGQSSDSDGMGGASLDELFRAALWEAELDGKKRNRSWKYKVKVRLKNPDEDDIATWRAWRVEMDRSETTKTLLEKARKPVHSEVPDLSLVGREVRAKNGTTYQIAKGGAKIGGKFRHLAVIAKMISDGDLELLDAA